MTEDSIEMFEEEQEYKSPVSRYKKYLFLIPVVIAIYFWTWNATWTFAGRQPFLMSLALLGVGVALMKSFDIGLKYYSPFLISPSFKSPVTGRHGEVGDFYLFPLNGTRAASIEYPGGDGVAIGHKNSFQPVGGNIFWNAHVITWPRNALPDAILEKIKREGWKPPFEVGFLAESDVRKSLEELDIPEEQLKIELDNREFPIAEKKMSALNIINLLKDTLIENNFLRQARKTHSKDMDQILEDYRRGRSSGEGWLTRLKNINSD